VIPLEGDETQVLSVAASVERSSNHPLAKTILEKANEARVPVFPAANLTTIAGKGVRRRS
jgi:cation transport ATPase